MYAMFNGLHYLYVWAVSMVAVDAWFPHSVSKPERIASKISGKFLHPT